MASERTVLVRLRAEVGSYVAETKKAAAQTEQLNDSVTKLQTSFDAYTDHLQQAAARKDAEKLAASQKQAWSQVSTGLLAVGAGAAAMVGTTVKAYADFDAAMSNVKATGADAAGSINQLRQAALQAGRDFGQFTATDAAEGIEALAKAGVSAADVLGGALLGSLSLAAAGQMQVAEAAEVTATTLAQFQLSGDQAAHVADLLAAGAGKAVGDVHDMALALKMAGTVANQYGVSVEETTGTLALFAQNAMIGSDAGTSMKQMLLQLASPTEEASKYLKSYNINAYDAQGNFVGMAGLAEQLKQSLGGLSQEQQNAALKTIFGADAIRSATILMREGADGVKQWTADVNDSGYAAQVAATKMDNLKGDLAQLGGAWETLTTRMGEGGNGPMRQAVQGLTDMVDAAGNLPPAMQRLGLGFGAMVAGVGLVGGGFMKAVTSAAELRDSWRTLSADAPRTAATFKAAAIGVGVLTAALIAATAAGSAYQASVDDQLQTQAQMIASVSALGKGGNLDKVNADIKAMGTDVTSVGEAMRYLDGQTGAWDRFGNAMGKAMPNVLGMKSAHKQFSDEVEKMDAALASLDRQTAASSFTAFVQQSGVSAEQAATHFTRYRESLVAQANELEKQVPTFHAANLSAQDYTDWMGGKVPAAVQAAAAAAKAAGKEMSDLGADMAATTLDARGLSNQMLTLADVTLGFERSGITSRQAIAANNKEIADAQAALKGATKGTQEWKDAQDKLRLAQIDSRLTITGYAQDMAKAMDEVAKTGTVAEVEALYKSAAQNIAAMGKEAGLSAKEIADLQKIVSGFDPTPKVEKAAANTNLYAAALGMAAGSATTLDNALAALPGYTAPTVAIAGASDTLESIEQLHASLEGLPPEKQTAIKTIADLYGVREAKQALASVKDRSVMVTVNGQFTGTALRAMGAFGAFGQADGGVVDYYANGGLRERHVAQIAPAGSWRVWAEPETGGEAYIPLAASKRGRSMDILEEVARRFGVALQPLARGGVMTGPGGMQMPAAQQRWNAPQIVVQAPTQQQPVYAPQITAYGTDPVAVTQQIASEMSHARREMDLTLPGGPSW